MHMHYQNLPVGDWPWHIILREFEQTTLLNSEGKEFLNRIINKDPHVHDPNRSFQGFYNPQMRFYIGLWLVDEINLIPTPSSLVLKLAYVRHPTSNVKRALIFTVIALQSLIREMKPSLWKHIMDDEF